MKFIHTTSLAIFSFMVSVFNVAGTAQLWIANHHLVYTKASKSAKGTPTSLTLNARRLKSVKATSAKATSYTLFEDSGTFIHIDGNCLDVSPDKGTLVMNPCSADAPGQVWGWKPLPNGKALLESYGDTGKRCATAHVAILTLSLSTCDATNANQQFENPSASVYFFA